MSSLLSSVLPNDTGDYWCLKRNIAGSVRGFVSLQYLSPFGISSTSIFRNIPHQGFSYFSGVAGQIGRSLLITLSFLLFGVLIMLSFTMYYFKEHKVACTKKRLKPSRTNWRWSFQSAKATLSDAELKLFIHGDQKSIDFSAPPYLLSEQVIQTKRKWELSFFLRNCSGSFSFSSFQIYLLPYDTSIEFPIDR